MTKKQKYSVVIFLFFSAVVGGGILWWFAHQFQRTEIVFLNIGQGDAILLSQGSTQVIIDSGRSGKELLSHVGRHVPFWDRHIELIIATHPDADHIGGFPSLLRSYTVDRVLTSGATSETEISKIFEKIATDFSVEKPEVIFRGTSIDFPAGGKLAVEYPQTSIQTQMDEKSDTNASSIVSRFTYGETSFLLTGDLPREESVLPEEKEVTVLKAAHHGSKYSTSQEFLNLVRPKEAVISVGKNSYGHPDSGVLERLKNMGTIIRRTDTDGDIRYRCSDGQNCVFSP